MPSRRNKTAGKKVTAQAAADGGTTEEDVRPSVTQVVEVIEEVDEPPVTPREEAMVEEEVPTRKAMVEELYTPEKKVTAMPEISVHKKGSKKPLMVWAIVTILVALITGGVLFAMSKNGSVTSLVAGPTPTTTPVPTPIPTPTPAEVDKTSFEIEVLNGGGTPGAGSKMKTFLEDLGYTVSRVGNTEEYTFETTEIHGKPEMTDAIAHLKADLKDTYSLGIVEADLDASASADVQVIVGKE